MNGFRVAVLATLLACFAGTAAAQGTAADPKAPAVSDDKSLEAKKPAAKAAPAKAAPKKAAPKKAPAKAPAKKVDDKAQTTARGGTVQKYPAGKAPELRDSKGNVIPTSPEAYDVSSATAPPPKKK